MSYSPKVSIITVNLNNIEGLKKTLKSVFCQTYKEYELIIIDGGSTDGSVLLIQQQTDNIKRWVSEPDRGIYHAMNKGINWAIGRYCLFLNSGDWLTDEKVLEKSFLADQNTDLLIGGCNVVKNEKLFHIFTPKHKLSFTSFYGSTIPHQSTFILRKLFYRIGLYKEEYTIHGDYDFWIRAIIINTCTISTLDIIVANYNLEGISNNPTYTQTGMNELREIQEKAIPKRVIDDYEEWRKNTVDLQTLYWAKSNRVVYLTIRVMFFFANKIFLIKQKLKNLI